MIVENMLGTVARNVFHDRLSEKLFEETGFR